jgi:hypothetical protein
LQTLIDTELQIVGRHRRDFGDIFDDVAVPVFTHQTTPGLTGQLGIKAFLYPFDALIIDIGKAQQISRNVPRGIKTARLIAQIDPRQVQLIDPLRLLRVDLARQIEKRA